MGRFEPMDVSRKLPTLIAAAMVCFAHTARAADDADAPKGAAVTVLKATKYCFNNTVEVSGLVMARDENMLRPDRPGLKVADVMVDPGDSVSAGQNLARLNLPEGGSVMIQAPVAGLVS